MKKLAKIAETGLGSYFFVGALPRQRDDFNYFTASQGLNKYQESVILMPPLQQKNLVFDLGKTPSIIV